MVKLPQMEQNESGLFRHLRLELIEENTGNKVCEYKIEQAVISLEKEKKITKGLLKQPADQSSYL